MEFHGASITFWASLKLEIFFGIFSRFIYVNSFNRTSCFLTPVCQDMDRWRRGITLLMFSFLPLCETQWQPKEVNFCLKMTKKNYLSEEPKQKGCLFCFFFLFVSFSVVSFCFFFSCFFLFLFQLFPFVSFCFLKCDILGVS